MVVSLVAPPSIVSELVPSRTGLVMLIVSAPVPALIVSEVSGVLNVVVSPRLELAVVVPPPPSVTSIVSAPPL